MTNLYLETDTRGFRGGYSQPGGALWLKSPQSLAEAVELAVDQVDANCVRDVSGARAGTVFQPRTMLGMLTFCYARQIYSSSEIARQLRREFQPFRVSGGDLPDSALLQRFRSVNRGAIVFCLKLALLFLAEEKIKQGVVTHVRRAHLAREANRRIIMAMFTDNLEAPLSQGSPDSAAFGLSLAVPSERRH